MKINWGTGIAIFYTAFVIVLVFMVVKTSRQSVELVSSDYYALDLNYEKHRQKKQNYRELREKPLVDYQEEASLVAIRFPHHMAGIDGKITFFRPSDKDRDREFRLELDTGNRMSVPTQELIPGLWRIKLDWQSEGKAYYWEGTMVF